MKNIYAIKDRMVGFGQPFTLKNNELAIRVITNLVNSEKPNQTQVDIVDKELYKIASFNEETGETKQEIEMLKILRTLVIPKGENNGNKDQNKA